MKLYLDCCCYNRPYDDLSQHRVAVESACIKTILNSSNYIFGSDFLDMEISLIKDAKKLNRVFDLYKLSISGHIEKTDQIISLALQLQSKSSIQSMDSLHIAAAETGMADVFLTVDDRLIRSCKGLPLSIRIMNPIEFLKEVWLWWILKIKMSFAV